MKSFLVVVLAKILTCYGALESRIVGGKYSATHEFPYAVFLITDNREHGMVACGSSILNQYILLTAAHCFDICHDICSFTAVIGNADTYQGLTQMSDHYTIHEDYDDHEIVNDIATARLVEPLKFGIGIQRVAILRKTIYHEVGYIAGWGQTENDTTSAELKYLTQKAIPRERCKEKIEGIPVGAFCGATGYKHEGYIDSGDSGSGLVVRGYIAIGLVSFKEANTTDYVAFTDISYYYDWIVKNTVKMHCRKLKNNKI